ncbi:hypothetical protein [Leucothrix pacifica]|uniref:Uncharacterized protein n=1 Tax=Leucothrix pacifica TaxID=1247513 RepID=A0A317C426_9GAMM|nr:hypothetical protein [Leucothrix pacifica]PWQ92941.1 hypothetical protein DKW60_18705 [Leucothrix pacifica]
MNISLDPGLIFLTIVMAVFGYHMGKRKTQFPILISGIAFFTGFIPILALICVIVLVLVKDTRDTTSNEDWL